MISKCCDHFWQKKKKSDLVVAEVQKVFVLASIVKDCKDSKIHHN